MGLVAVRSKAVESNPKYQAAVKAQQEKERRKMEPEAIAPVQEEKPAVKPEPQTVRQIIAAVAKEHGLTHDDVVGKSRNVNIVAARHEAIEAVHRARPKLSLNGIARYFGNRHHTTILHALKKRGIKYV